MEIRNRNQLDKLDILVTDNVAARNHFRYYYGGVSQVRLQRTICRRSKREFIYSDMSTIKPSFNNNFKGVGLPFLEDITKLKGNIYEGVLNFYDSINITFEYYGYYFEGLFHGLAILEYLAQLLITKESKAILIMVYLMV